jgi:hypothetical protein
LKFMVSKIKAKKLNLNKSIMVLAFALSVVTAWIQFKPKSDVLVFSKVYRTNDDDIVKMHPSVGRILGMGEKYNFIDAVTWKIIISNLSDHKISIVDLSVNSIENSSIENSGIDMLKYFSPSSQKNGEFPFHIDANESVIFDLKLEIPVKMLKNDDCYFDGKLSEIDRCYFEKGVDIFGNKNIEEPILEPPLGMKATLITQDIEARPKYGVEVKTARAKTFRYLINY